jgi:hypothetical protein
MRSLPLLLALVALASPTRATSLDAVLDRYDRLLESYVVDLDVDYEAWHESASDRRALHEVIDALAAVDPSRLAHDAAVAYWINLYNAVTLDLVLDHWPVESIRDIGGSPWPGPFSRELVRVAGRDLSLDGIEKEILLPLADDARVHFALNCASRGCPPLRASAYRGALLDAQLDDATAAALHHPRWLRVEEDTIHATRILDWYHEDFVREAGSVRAFLARYRDDLPPGDAAPEYLDYDWSLNRARP